MRWGQLKRARAAAWGEGRVEGRRKREFSEHVRMPRNLQQTLSRLLERFTRTSRKTAWLSDGHSTQAARLAASAKMP